MIKKLLAKKISIWLGAVLYILTVGGLAVFFFVQHQVTYSHDLYVPDPSGRRIALEYGSQPALSDPEFFQTVKEGFIKEGVTFIEMNLQQMQLKVYEAGGLIYETDIAAKGRDGSWGETPAGIYRIESKNKNAFSSISKVYMPYSLQFYGNYFIHGWPYHPDGRPISSVNSGGCVRLKTTDAAELFGLISVGTPVLVYEEGYLDDGFDHDRLGNIVARNYLAADLRSNFVFVSREAQVSLPIGSIVKFLTALVATDHLHVERNLTVSATASETPTYRPRLEVGQKISVIDLLFPLLRESSNQSVAVFGDQLGRERLTNLVNGRAKTLGMKNTQLADAYGSTANLSTAEDLFNLAKYLYNSRLVILQISSDFPRPGAYHYQPARFTDLENLSGFAGRSNFVGGQAWLHKERGTATAMTVFELEIRGQKRPVFIFVADSRDYIRDIDKIIEYILFAYR